jgi:hypothetical protein
VVEKSEVDGMFQFLKDKLNKLTYSHELLVKQSNNVAKSLNKLEDLNSADITLLRKQNKQSACCKITMAAHVNCCENFIEFAYKLYMKLFLSRNKLHFLETNNLHIQR